MFMIKLFRPIGCSVALAMLSLIVTSAQVRAVPTRYFDTNGTTVGSGVTANGVYSWEDPIWNSVDPTNDPVNGPPAANGTIATSNWTDGDFPRFAAGVDALGLNYTVNVN